MQTPYHDGNRLAVPAAVCGPHFLYKTKTPDFDPADLKLVQLAAMRHIDAAGILPGNITGLGHAELESICAGAGAAFDRLITELGTPDDQRFRAGVLICEWASPHIDDSYEGNAFLSYVMHTGPEPYVMQSFHTSLTKGNHPTQQISTSTRVLNVGDTFMFDPTTAHMVVPRRPESGQLLILLQIVLDEASDEDRANLTERFPRNSNDEDQHNVFQGY